VAGPTAGGKSAYALELARKNNGIVINADSRQIYSDLPTLTAQPTMEEKNSVPHELYGILNANEACSAGNWREIAEPVIEKTLAAGKTPIVVGGTGLYIKALTEGLSPIPDVPDHIRAAAVQKQKELGNPAFHEALKKRDPVMAERFHPGHTARLVRAWEVLEATGKSLSEWQKEAKLAPPDHWNFEIHKIMPGKEELDRNCDARFLKMIEAGALAEVREFSHKIENGQVDEKSQLIKSLGFKPLRRHIQGEITLSEAATLAQLETRQYAKRQMTWFRHQL
jgi:tRNA dimethylallyltransferase